MGAFCKRILVTFLAIGIVCISTQVLHAYQQYAIGENISLFGTLNQHDVDTWNDSNSVSCGPTAATNTFVYLENRFPDIYGNALVPLNGSDPYADMVTTARNLFSNYMYTGQHGWTGTTTKDFIMGQLNYIEERVPGVTTYDAQSFGASSLAPPWVHSVYPTWDFFYQELTAGEGVEVLIDWPGESHYVSVRGFMWNDTDNDNVMDFQEAGISFMNPWTGAYGQAYIWYDDVNNRLATSYYPSGVTNAWIEMAMATSPVPEPPHMLLLGVGLLCVLVTSGKIWKAKIATRI